MKLLDFALNKSMTCKFLDPLQGLNIKMHIHHSFKASCLDRLLSRFPLHPMGEKETMDFALSSI